MFYPLTPQTGFHYLINLYFLYSYSTRLESGIYHTSQIVYEHNPVRREESLGTPFFYLRVTWWHARFQLAACYWQFANLHFFYQIHDNDVILHNLFKPCFHFSKLKFPFHFQKGNLGINFPTLIWTQSGGVNWNLYVLLKVVWWYARFKLAACYFKFCKFKFSVSNHYKTNFL